MLHVLESFAPGGMETTFLNVLAAFRTADASIEHHVLSFAGGSLEQGYRARAHQVTVGRDAETIDRHVDAGYDVAHVLFERCAYRIVPQLVARTATPVLYGKGYDMGGMYRLNEGLRWQADETLLAACDAATFTTPQLAAGYHLPAGRTTVLRKAADVSRFAAIADPSDETPQRVLCIANLHPRKRLGDLILALERVKWQWPAAELRLVGGGNAAEADRLAQLALDRGLAGAVSFAGSCADVAPEIAAARIIALPSSCEGVPTALLEGMAAGRPAVATAVGHVTSIIDDGREGFLVTPGDVPALAERLTRLLADTDLARRMGAAARARAAGHDVRIVANLLLTALKRAR